MRDRIKPFDVSILSTYMGRVGTLVVAVFVVTVGVSAWLKGRDTRRNFIDICVSAKAAEGNAADVFDPFRALVSAETRRPTVVTVCGNEWPAGHDLYVMPLDAYLSAARDLGIEAVFEVADSKRQADSAVLVARTGTRVADFGNLAVSDVVFAAPDSPNGFLVQLEALAGRGFRLPNSISAFNFEGEEGAEVRVILAVLCGRYQVGACKLGDITRLTERGVVRGGELTVLHREPALPEVVIAVPREDVDYYAHKLGAIAELLNGEKNRTHSNGSVELLRAYGVESLRQVDSSSIEKARELRERFAGLFSSASE